MLFRHGFWLRHCWACRRTEGLSEEFQPKGCGRGQKGRGGELGCQAKDRSSLGPGLSGTACWQGRLWSASGWSPAGGMRWPPALKLPAAGGEWCPQHPRQAGRGFPTPPTLQTSFTGPSPKEAKKKELRERPMESVAHTSLGLRKRASGCPNSQDSEAFLDLAKLSRGPKNHPLGCLYHFP